MEVILFILAAVILIAGYFLRKRGQRPGKVKGGALRKEIHRQLRLPPDAADQTIERHIERLRERYPNRSEEWYLEKILYDLERDR